MISRNSLRKIFLIKLAKGCFIRIYGSINCNWFSQSWRNLVNKVFSSSVSSNSTVANFEGDLARFTKKTPSSIKDINQLREDISSFPEVQNFISKNEGNVISIDKMSDGSIRFSLPMVISALPSNHISSP